MNDIKWLKLDVNILNHNKIKMIRKYPDGDALFALWIGLICLAMKSDQPGFIYVCDSVPYSAEDLALLFDLEIKTVEMGLALFEKFDMIQNIKGGIIEVLRFREYQNIEGIERKRELTRKRVNRYREKVKQLPVKRVTDALVTECNADRLDKIRIDKNREDIDKEKNKDIKIRHHDAVLLTSDEYSKLIEKLGEKETLNYIEKLNNYILSKGKKYKSHYHTILNWVNMAKSSTAVEKKLYEYNRQETF